MRTALSCYEPRVGIGFEGVDEIDRIGWRGEVCGGEERRGGGPTPGVRDAESGLDRVTDCSDGGAGSTTRRRKRGGVEHMCLRNRDRDDHLARRGRGKRSDRLCGRAGLEVNSLMVLHKFQWVP